MSKLKSLFKLPACEDPSVMEQQKRLYPAVFIEQTSAMLLGLVNAIKGMLPYMVILKLFAYIMMPFKDHKKSREFFISSGRQLGRAEFMAWFSLVVHDMNALKNLKGLKDKVLFITGSEDFIFISGVKKKYKELKESKLAILKRCGHVCNIQKSKEFNQIALDYIDESYSEQ